MQWFLDHHRFDSTSSIHEPNLQNTFILGVVGVSWGVSRTGPKSRSVAEEPREPTGLPLRGVLTALQPVRTAFFASARTRQRSELAGVQPTASAIQQPVPPERAGGPGAGLAVVARAGEEIEFDLAAGERERAADAGASERGHGVGGWREQRKQRELRDGECERERGQLLQCAREQRERGGVAGRAGGGEERRVEFGVWRVASGGGVRRSVVRESVRSDV